MRQQIARWNDIGGVGRKEEFLEFASSLAREAERLGTVVRGTVQLGSETVKNARIYRMGDIYMVVDPSNRIRSFIAKGQEGWGHVAHYWELGGK